jgi:hypothetical protein
MPQINGSDIAALLYHETAAGVDPGVPAGLVAYFTSLGLKADRNPIEDDTITNSRGMQRPGRGNLNVSGDISAIVTPQTVGFFLSHALGTPATTGSGPYTHVFTPKALPPGFRLEKDYTDVVASKVETYKGLRIGSANFDFPQEGFARASYSCTGLNYAIITAPLDATPTDQGHTGITGFDGLIKVGGSQVGNILSMKLTVENNLDTGLYTFPASGATPGTRHSLPHGRCKISGTVETVLEDFSLIDLANAGTATSFEVLYSLGTGDGTAGNETLAFTVANADIPLTTPTLETESGLKLSIPFQGFVSGADLGLEVELINALTAAEL